MIYYVYQMVEFIGPSVDMPNNNHSKYHKPT